MSDARFRELATRLVEMTPGSPPPPSARRFPLRRRAWVGAVAAAAVLLAIGVPAVLLGRGPTPVIDTTAPSLQTTTTLAPGTSSSVSGEPSTTLLPSAGDLAAWRARWEANRPQDYFIGGEVTCDGECAAGLSAQLIDSFVLGSGVGGDAPSVDELFEILESLGTEEMELVFDPELGYPAHATWSANGATTSITVSVDPIDSTLDGVWLLASGVVDGEDIPAGEPIEVRIGTGLMRFPVDCNSAGGRFTLNGESFDMGEWGQSAVGCGEDTQRAALFTDALARASEANRDGDSLVLSSASTELRLTLIDDDRTRFWGVPESIMLDEDYMGSGSPGDYRIGSATFQIDESFGAGDEMFLLRNTTAPQVCIDFPIDGQVVSDDGCFVVGAVNAVGFPSEMRIFARGPMPDGSGDGVWTLASRLEPTGSGGIDVDGGAVVLAVAASIELDCPTAASIEDLASVDTGSIVEIDPDTAEIIRISCR